MGTIVESRFQSENGGSLVNNQKSERLKLVIAILICTIELVVIVFLLVMVFSKDEKECTIENALEALEGKDESSEEYKMLEDVMFDTQEEPLMVFAEAMKDEELSVESSDYLKQWSLRYADKIGGEAIGSESRLSNVRAFMASDEEGLYWRLLAETGGACARFDFSTDFMFLENYSLTAGNCDEFAE